MGKFTEKLKSVLMHHELTDIPAKQVDRWEGEGGFVAPTKPSRRRVRRRRPRDKPVDGDKA